MRPVTEHSESPNDYSVLYFRPAALTSDDPSRPGLLGVTVNLGIYDTATKARMQFASQGHLDVDSIAGTVVEASEDAKLIRVDSIDVELQGTDLVVAFRAHYSIGTTQLVDYRYRFLVDNALANVIVTARVTGTGQEPDEFRERALEIAERQIAYLNEARH
jgi:hypothetical protein